MDKAPGSEGPGKRYMSYAVVIASAFVVIAIINVFIAGPASGACSHPEIAQSRQACLSATAIQTRNVSLCNMLDGSSRYSCYYALAGNATNKATCFALTADNSTYGAACFYNLAISTFNQTDCAYSGSNGSRCMIYVAAKTGRTSSCMPISNLTYRTACIRAIAISEAQGGNVSACKKLHVNDTAYNISTALYYANLSANTTDSGGYGDLEVLLSLPNTTFEVSNVCYVVSAASHGNSSACTYISDNELMQICLANAGNNATQATAANATGYASAIAQCSNQTYIPVQVCELPLVINRAAATGNATLCSSLNNTMSEYCYSSMAGYERNASYCSIIQNASIRTSCVLGVGYNASYQ
jgi:hypothetical protein